MDREDARQLFHIFVGIGALAVLLLFGRGFLIAAIFFTLIIGTLLINARLLGKKIALVQWFVERFEREDAPMPGWGSACYAAGALIAATFLDDAGQIAAVLVVLGIGDGVSTIIGRRGRLGIPYNSNKTLEGSMGLFFSALLAYWFIGPLVIPMAFVAAVAESAPKIDDNLMIPIACAIFLLIFA
jgi:dolichol kinase